ncbi:hypothetical protein J4422_02505 [Candidatus Pacearchaeota archaeon]|nr:hypothetical protein [Candidatus Pacearchaeota archaeon]
MLSQDEIRLTVAKYSIHYSDDLRGMLKKPHIFLIGGERTGDCAIGDYKIKHGYALDIIADKLEKEEYGKEDR